MDGSRTREALAEFLDYLADKGMMEKATAQARKAAVSKILAILDRADADNVTELDLDDVMSRFTRLHGKDYTPQSLVTYKSRLASAIDDFKSYLSNPMAFRPSVRIRERAKPKTVQSPSETKSAPLQEARAEPSRSNPVPMATANIIPIPIRADLTVFIQGLPFDLTESEARKIAGVITAMAQV
jgi:site-specific recombinase XerD